MTVVNKQKVKTILLISTVLLLMGNKQEVIAEEEYLIVRIVDAEYPPSVYVFTGWNYTGFSLRFYMEVENPTQSEINITYWCSPLPFPHLRTNLENESLEATISTQYEWSYPQNYSMPPGIEQRSHPAAIIIFNYEETQLPLGEYEIWYDYTDCSYTYVPVITQSMFIYVTEDSISYFFEYNNETKVVSTTQFTDTTNQFTDTANLVLIYFITPYIVNAILNRMRMRMRKINK